MPLIYNEPKIHATKYRKVGKKLCAACSNPSEYRVEIRHTCFRGEDDLWNLCKYHKELLNDKEHGYGWLSNDIEAEKERRKQNGQNRTTHP